VDHRESVPVRPCRLVGSDSIPSRVLKTERGGEVRVKLFWVTSERGSYVGRDGFERSKIRKSRSNSCWTPTDTALTGRNGWIKGRSKWVIAGEVSQFFFCNFKKAKKNSQYSAVQCCENYYFPC
jgi:hypothetical protein